MYELDSNNNLSGASIFTFYSGIDVISRRIFIATTSPSLKSISCDIEVPADLSSIELKKIAIDYQLRDKIDKTTCNGLVDFEKGCVLFNDRQYAGAGWASTTWDADRTIIDGIGKPAEPGITALENDSNQLIKVEPDRICDQWLSCRSYIKDQSGQNVCFDIGLCDSVDKNGNCRNMAMSADTNQAFKPAPNNGSQPNNASQFYNTTGYAKAGVDGNTPGQGSLRSDLLPLSTMSQKGELAAVPNGSFEFYGDNNYPLGWTGFKAEWKADHFTTSSTTRSPPSPRASNTPLTAGPSCASAPS